MANSCVRLLLIVSAALVGSCLATTIEYDNKAIIINGTRRLLLSGSIHYPRSTAQMWPDLIKKGKEGGLDAIETYIFWNVHEPRRREYNFKGNLDFVQFFKRVQEAGLYGILRIGPYVCAEWNYGGFPVWLHNIPGIKMRTDNELYKNEMQIFTTKIVNMVKDAKLFASQGGPIILAQIENEYGNVEWKYGDAGKSYVNWCANMAEGLNIGIPWIMCQQGDAPAPIINTCNGFYCDNWSPNRASSPKIWTENWTGWFKKWGEKDPQRTAEDVAFAVARFFQKGGVLQNYYMYHGGTNFGRTSGGPFIATTYDYDAPLDEYGNLNQPKWGHLKELHAAIKVGEKILTNYTNVDTTKYSGGWVELTTYRNTATGERFCYLSNTNVNDTEIDLKQDGQYFVPAWSVSILQNCNQEIHNTAKVRAESTVMAKKHNPRDKHEKLSWYWTPEKIRDTLDGRGRFKAHQLIEQKAASADQSDYLWYMTNFNYNGTAKKNMTLIVNFSGQLLHTYVNRKLISMRDLNLDTQYGYSFTTAIPVPIRPGANHITLLSVTVGLQNYGVFFDEGTEGIPGGPVQLIEAMDATTNTTHDLSNAEWNYKVGLNGLSHRLYDPRATYGEWYKYETLKKKTRSMMWFKTSFRAPSGTEPVVLDLLGMNKGEAWVNGNSLGRFWPSRMTDNNGCGPCDYRGTYSSSKCPRNCNASSQRWYHVPRSFMKKGAAINELVLFEEMGGDPRNVSVQIVTVGSICGNAFEGDTLELACKDGRIIAEIEFASYGSPQGSCGYFQEGDFHATQSLHVVEQICVGKDRCSIPVSQGEFGASMYSKSNRLAVQAICLEHSRKLQEVDDENQDIDFEDTNEEPQEDDDIFI